MPQIRDSSDAIFNRMILLDFNNIIERDKMDFNLKDKIRLEGAGIFNWAFQGLKRLNENGKFTESSSVLENINTLKLINNTVYYFVSECYEVVGLDESYISVEELYERYKGFCHKVGGKGIFKKNVFGKEIKKIYGKQVEPKNKYINGVVHRVWEGLKEKSLLAGEPIWEE
jgi:putative DNA primase/helicase